MKIQKKKKVIGVSEEKAGEKNRALVPRSGKKPMKIGRPNGLLYRVIYAFLWPKYRRKYGMVRDTAALADLHSPALVIAPHTSNKDHWLMGITLYPHRPTFVISEHFLAKPDLRPILKQAHVITKKMFTPDVSTIMNILRAKREGNVIVLFPEGRLSCNGRTGRVADGTAALVKKLGIDVYAVTFNGASCTFPKWARPDSVARPGKIRVTAEKLMTAEETKTLSPDEITARLQAAVTHDDMAVMHDEAAYRSDKMAEGLDGILFCCPVCGQEGTLSTEGTHIRCTCGLDATVDEHYDLHGAPFSTILAWYDWQAGELDLDGVMETDAIVGAVDENGNMDKNAGTAHVRMDRATFSFEGTVFGKPVSFTRDTPGITAFPVTVGEEFDIYYNNTLYYIHPQPDKRLAVKWVAWLDRLTEENARAAAQTAEK